VEAMNEMQHFGGKKIKIGLNWFKKVKMAEIWTTPCIKKNVNKQCNFICLRIPAIFMF
jgi:hypothetical protein